jgi:hypothetical protein
LAKRIWRPNIRVSTWVECEEMTFCVIGGNGDKLAVSVRSPNFRVLRILMRPLPDELNRRQNCAAVKIVTGRGLAHCSNDERRTRKSAGALNGYLIRKMCLSPARRSEWCRIHLRQLKIESYPRPYYVRHRFYSFVQPSSSLPLRLRSPSAFDPGSRSVAMDVPQLFATRPDVFEIIRGRNLRGGRGHSTCLSSWIRFSTKSLRLSSFVVVNSFEGSRPRQTVSVLPLSDSL